MKPRSIDAGDGEGFLRELRDDLKARRFAPLPVRERMIPKASGKLRRLGIATARDRAVQASLKLVLEPIFEADFKPCSYGFRPMRRAQDAIEEIHHFGRLSYEWILEGDIASCFDEISHSALMDRVRGRIADKRVLGLVKAFLAAGILSEDGAVRGSKTGTPQGGILSPCLANIALSVLDEHFAEAWETMMAGDHDRRRRRRRGEPMYRLVRYADDFVVMVSGTEALKAEVATVISTIGLRLSEGEDRGLPHQRGVRFSRRPHPAEAQTRIEQGVRLLLAIEAGARVDHGQDQGDHETGNEPTAVHPLAPDRRGAAGLDGLLPARLLQADLQLPEPLHVAPGVGWLRRKHRRGKWKAIRRRYLASPAGLVPHDDGIWLFNPASVPVTRYRYRGTKIPNPWTERTTMQTIE